ncbi:hydroxylamine reductase [bacterium]|nr:hydroxylamine reductase [bacterium]
MSMFCYQCQETMKNSGCTVNGMCGKKADTANLQDLLIYTLKGIALVLEKAAVTDREAVRFLIRGLFATITNANFNSGDFVNLISEALSLRDRLKKQYGISGELHDAAVWSADNPDDMRGKAALVGILNEENQDVRSLKELLVYGLKGIAAYADHARVLGYEDDEIYAFVVTGLASTTKTLPREEMIAMVMHTGETAVKTMALLDRANTETYGNPELTEVNLGVRGNPGILVSGHDLRDMEALLRQTEGTGVDVYTHGEMLPAHYYPAFKRYGHFAGNYGNAWWLQKNEFASFNGPVLMTTNCLVPPADSYRDRVFTTGVVGFEGLRHIPEPEEGGEKDFSEVISLAKTCDPPVELESGTLVGGFAHHQVLALADRVVEAVKSGAVKRFVVMAGCDGRHKERDYFTRVAGELPDDTVILTAGCAKYRYNKLGLGDIGGIPRVLDAGQCNDSYSLAVIALKLKEVFGLDDINDLPISYDIAWYEQKAVAVLLALLSLGVKGIRLGPTLPAFLSPGVARILVETFSIKPTGDVKTDIEAMISGH